MNEIEFNKLTLPIILKDDDCDVHVSFSAYKKGTVIKTISNYGFHSVGDHHTNWNMTVFNNIVNYEINIFEV